MNEKRAGWAHMALLEFMAQTGQNNQVEAMGDLIADLFHQADRMGLDTAKLMGSARRHYHEETSADPDPRQGQSQFFRSEYLVTVIAKARPPETANLRELDLLVHRDCTIGNVTRLSEQVLDGKMTIVELKERGYSRLLFGLNHKGGKLKKKDRE